MIHVLKGERQRETKTEIHRKEGHWKTEAEAGIMLPLAKGHLERLGEASKDFPRSFQRECGQYLDFGLLTSRTVKEQVFVVLNPKTS